MTLALKIRYTPGDVEPSAATNTQRVILSWRKSRDDYWNREQIRQMNEEKLSRRDPETAEEFRRQEQSDAARQRQRSITEAEENRQYAQQQKEAQERLRQQTKAAEESYTRYWTATTAEDRTAALIAYAQSIGTADGYSGSGFATQAAVDKTLASLNSVTQCPEAFKPRYREIRGIVSGSADTPASNARQTSQQRLLGASR